MARLAPSVEELSEFNQWLRTIRPALDNELINKILAYEQMEHRGDTDFCEYYEILSGEAGRTWFEFEVPYHEIRNVTNPIIRAVEDCAPHISQAAGSILLVSTATHQEHSMNDYNTIVSAVQTLLHPRCQFFSCLFSTKKFQACTSSFACLLILSGINRFEPFIGPPYSRQDVVRVLSDLPAFLESKEYSL